MSRSIGKCLGAVCEFEKIITSAVCGSILVAMLWYCRLFICKDGANMRGGGRFEPPILENSIGGKGEGGGERGKEKEEEEA